MSARVYLITFLMFLSGLLSAQTFRGGIQGTVTDGTGAAVPQAEVEVVNEGTGQERTLTTDDSGNYTATELPLGTYSVKVSKQGFATSTAKGVPVTVTTYVHLDVKLAPGQVSENVEVTAAVPMVATTSNTMGGTISEEQAKSLPINGRDFTKMLVLVAGATADANGDTDSPGSFGVFTINGNRGRANNFLLDGTDMNDGYRNDPAINEPGVFGTPATLLPLDAVAEMGVLSNMEAEYGRNSGATVNIVTKSGTNQIHGDVFEYFRNSALDARNYFNAEPNPQNLFHNNQFGASLGGPLIKDKTFWFAAYEGWREYGSLPAVANVPTQAQVNAFTAGGGVVNPVIANLMARNPWGIPLPAGDPSNPAYATVQVADKFMNSVDSVIAKIDQHIRSGGLLTGRYYYGNSNQSFPFALGGGTTIPNYNTVTPTRVQVLSLSYTQVFTPKLLMEVRGGWNRFAEGFYPEDINFNPATIGLDTGVGPQDYGLPLMTFSDGTAGLGASNSIPRHRFDTNWQFFDNVSYSTGKHNWKVGVEYRRTTVNQYYDLAYRGKLKFNTFDDFLAGNVTNGGAQFGGNSLRDTHQNNVGAYVQDDFRITRKLTIDWGVRWDYYGVISEDNNQLSVFNTTTASIVQVGSPGQKSLYPKDLNNFAPRVAIAYDVFGDGKTVLRSGWGLYYDAFSQDFFVGQVPFNTFSPGVAYNSVGPNPINHGSPVGTIVAGQPVFTGFAPTTDVWTVEPNMRTPYIQNYNLNVEHQITNTVSAQVAYVGSTGKKLFRFRDINQLDPATQSQAFPGWGYINQFESTAWSNYNSLQASLKFRNFHGLTSQVNYTWSHALDNASDGQDYVPNAAQPDNSFNPAAEKASSNFDRRQSFAWNFNYQLPGYGSKSLLKGGWAVDGVVTLQTGQPYNLNSFENYNGTGEFFERPDVVGNPFSGTSLPNAILNLSAFAAPCDWDPVAGGCIAGTQHYGNLPRNAFVGPPYKNFDFSVSKSFQLGERVNAQLRADFLNIFNHPNFSNPALPNFLVNLENNALVAPVPGDPACAAAPYTGCRAVGQGYLPIVATPDVGPGNPFVGGGGARNIQLALRIAF